jgi:hypothetical protein
MTWNVSRFGPQMREFAKSHEHWYKLSWTKRTGMWLEESKTDKTKGKRRAMSSSESYQFRHVNFDREMERLRAQLMLSWKQEVVMPSHHRNGYLLIKEKNEGRATRTLC